MTTVREAGVGRELTVVPRRHVGRWVAAALLLLALAWLAGAFANADIDWATVRHYFGAGPLLRGLLITIALTLVAMLLGIVLGTAVGVMRLSRNPVTAAVAWGYVWIFRGTPVYLQLLVWFNLALIFPYLTIPGVTTARTVDLITPFAAASLGLGINQGAYTSEVVRGGIQSVDEGQTEAAHAIGMTNWMTLRKVVLPQAMRVILPPIGNEFIGMVKTTSLASAIGVTEILNEAQSIYIVNNRIMELLIVCGVWYLAAVSVLSIAQFYLERHFARGSSSRALPPTPLQRLRGAFAGPKAAR